LKKSKRQNIIIVTIAVVIIGAIVGQNYSVEQTKQKGLKFGNELQQIQEEVKQAQVEFNSNITQWQEGDLTKEELLDYAESHFKKLEDIILKYDELVPPDTFSASVDLFKMSTQSQLESDREFIEWIKSNQEPNRVRSDALLQESFDYEMMALGEFNAAKTGVKEYDAQEKFEAPDMDLVDRVNKVWESMKDKCNSMYTNQTDNNNELEKCLSDADAWKKEHLP
jgi:hypothetical protein